MTDTQIRNFAEKADCIRSVSKGAQGDGFIYSVTIRPKLNTPIKTWQWDVEHSSGYFHYWITYNQLRAARLDRTGWIYFRDGYKILPLTLSPVNLYTVDFRKH